MPIPFAAVRYIQRSRGHSTLERLAYICRSEVISQRTSQRFDYRDRAAPAAVTTLIPSGAPEQLRDAETLWNAVELASKRSDAALGLDVVLSLPATGELADHLALELATRFIIQAVVEPHGLGATIALHRPHDLLEDHDRALEAGEQDQDDRFARAMKSGDINFHAHVLLTPRQITAEGLARRRYTGLDVQHKNLASGLDWGRLWGRFQDAFFFEQGLALRVRPNAPQPLRQEPLTKVRRQRKNSRNQPIIKGRALIVGPAREEVNRDELSTISGAVDCFDGPFTRNQLSGLFERHWARDYASELTLAAIGLGDVIEIVPPPGSTDQWYVPVGGAVTELACLGRSLILANRRMRRREKPDPIRTGFPSHTAQLLHDVASATDLAIIEVGGSPDALVQDLAWLAEREEQMPVSVLHAGGHPPPRSVTRTIGQLATRPVSRAMIIVDEPDALTTKEVDLLLQAAVAGKNQLVMIRRKLTGWPRTQLIDTLAQQIPVLRWNSEAAGARPAIEILGLTDLLAQRIEGGSLRFVEAEQLDASSLVSLLHRTELTGLVIPNAALREEVVALTPPIQPLTVSSTIYANPATHLVIPVTELTVRTLPELLRAGTNKHIEFEVSGALAGSLEQLEEAITRSRYPTGATSCRPIGTTGMEATSKAGPPYFAVTPHATITTKLEDMRAAIVHWTTGPLQLDWPGYIRAGQREARELQIGLQRWVASRTFASPELMAWSATSHAPSPVVNPVDQPGSEPAPTGRLQGDEVREESMIGKHADEREDEHHIAENKGEPDYLESDPEPEPVAERDDHIMEDEDEGEAEPDQGSENTGSEADEADEADEYSEHELEFSEVDDTYGD